MPVKIWITSILKIVGSGKTGTRPKDADDAITGNNIILIERSTIIVIISPANL
jgi:hypothetical protein